MPKDELERCVGKDAEAVAAYIHYRFFSESAQIRNRPPRVGLARLTANQLRQSLADLFADLDEVASPRDRRGVKGIYFKGFRWKNENKKLDRIDLVYYVGRPIWREAEGGEYCILSRGSGFVFGIHLVSSSI